VESESSPADKEESVLAFLTAFREKKERYDIIFYEREKNLRALLELDMLAEKREELVTGLSIENFYRGPREDLIHTGNRFWEFGTSYHGVEIYIKLSLGFPEEPVWCISFHKAERKISYPLRRRR